jgi:hypothetical protein
MNFPNTIHRLILSLRRAFTLLIRYPYLIGVNILLAVVLVMVLPGIGLVSPALRLLTSAFALLLYYLGLWLSVQSQIREQRQYFAWTYTLLQSPILLFATTGLLLDEAGKNLQYLVTLWPFLFIAIWIACAGAVIALLNPAVLHRYLLIVVLGWGLYLRLLGLLTEGLWYDELFTLWRSRPELSFEALIDLTRNDFHPPFYYIVMWLWFQAVGVSPFTARIIGVFGALAGMVAMYLLGRRTGGKWAGVFAAFLTCVTYSHIYYSQEVRSYILLFAATAWCYQAFLDLFYQPRLKSAAMYAVALATVSYLHYFGFLVLLAHGLFLLLYPKRLISRRGKLLRWYAGSAIAGLAAYLPWASVMADRLAVQKYWIAPTPSEFYVDYFHWYFQQPLLSILYTVLIAGYLVHIFSANPSPSRRDCRERDTAALCLVGVLTGWFVPYLHSINALPILCERYTLVCLPPILLLISLAVTRMPFIQARIILTVIILYGAMVGLFAHENYYKTPHRMQVRELVTDLLRHPPSILAADTYLLEEFTYYFDKLGPHSMPIVYTDEEFKQVMLAHAEDERLWVWLFHALTVTNLNELTIDVLNRFFVPSRRIEYINARAELYRYNEKIPRNYLREYLTGDEAQRADLVVRIDEAKNETEPQLFPPSNAPVRKPQPTR